MRIVRFLVGVAIGFGIVFVIGWATDLSGGGEPGVLVLMVIIVPLTGVLTMLFGKRGLKWIIDVIMELL